MIFKTLEEVEREYILLVMNKLFYKNQDEIASILGISSRGLRLKIKKYSLVKEESDSIIELKHDIKSLHKEINKLRKRLNEQYMDIIEER